MHEMDVYVLFAWHGVSRRRHDAETIGIEKPRKEFEFEFTNSSIIKNANWPRKICGCRAFKFIHCNVGGSLPILHGCCERVCVFFFVFEEKSWWRPCVTHSFDRMSASLLLFTLNYEQPNASEIKVTSGEQTLFKRMCSK